MIKILPTNGTLKARNVLGISLSFLSIFAFVPLYVCLIFNLSTFFMVVHSKIVLLLLSLFIYFYWIYVFIEELLEKE